LSPPDRPGVMEVSRTLDGFVERRMR